MHRHATCIVAAYLVVAARVNRSTAAGPSRRAGHLYLLYLVPGRLQPGWPSGVRVSTPWIAPQR